MPRKILAVAVFSLAVLSGGCAGLRVQWSATYNYPDQAAK